MKTRFIEKSWLSPFLAVSFLMVASTGIVLLFHGRVFPLMVLHEFMSVFFCIAGLLHTWVNWRPLIGYFRQRKAFVSLAVGILMGSLFVAMALGHSAEHETEVSEGSH
jgi:hypothetical protein